MYAVTNPEEAAPQSVLDAFAAFFESLWSPSTNPDGSTVQKAGMSYVYDEDGTLIAQTLTGGAQSSWGQSARYIYLPTASGPMPVAAIYGTKHYAIQSDHLNTPRRLIQSDGQVAWQWAYSAFGDEKPTIAKTRFANADLNQSFGTTSVAAVTFNLRYPGQYFDQESGLHYNYHRSYSATLGGYIQTDPIGLQGGWNSYGYAKQNPLRFTDPTGLIVGVDDLVVGGSVLAVGCLMSTSCSGAVGSALSTAANAAGNAIQAVVDICSPNKPAIPDVKPNDFCEQLALAEAKAGAGREKMGAMGDSPRLVAHYGAGPWIKMEHTHTCSNGRKLVIHYFTNGRGKNVELKFV